MKRLCLNEGWIQYDVTYSPAFPCVGDMHQPITCLDDGRVGELLPLFAFQTRSLPFTPVGRYRHVEHIRPTFHFSGELLAWLYTTSMRPSLSTMPSMPEFAHQKSNSRSSVHVNPPSVDSMLNMRSCFVRPTACNILSVFRRMLGWIASMTVVSFIGPILSHVTPRSRVRSNQTHHPWFSVLDGQNVAILEFPGLFLTGLITPSGRRTGSDHVTPQSHEVFSIPHHSRGFGPTL